MAIQYYADQNIEGKLTVSTVLRVNDSGSSIKGVGINTMNPGGELQVVGAGSIGNIYISANAAGSSVTDSLHIKKEALKASIINRDGGDLALGANSNEYVTIKATGNVGIAATSPNYKLEVSGTLGVNRTDGIIFAGGAAAGLGNKITSDTSNNFIFSTSLPSIPYTTSTRMTILNGGNVGIATTSPNSKLQVDGEIDANGGDGYKINGKPWAAESSNNLRLGDWDGEVFSTSIYDNNSANVVTIKDYGTMINCSSLVSSYGANASLAVGTIGSSSAGAAVITLANRDTTASAGDLTGTIQFAIKGNATNSLGFTSAIISGSIYGNAGSGNSGGGILDFKTSVGGTGVSPATRMRINQSGNVGIGTTAPLEKLQVAGNAAIYGAIKGYTGSSSNQYLSILQSSSFTYISTGTSNETLYFGIGPTSNVTNISVAGTATATNFILLSDKTLKDKIKNIKASHVDIKWKNFELISEPGVKRSGVIAQELEEKHPEFIRTDKDGLKSVAYIDLLITKIAELEARIKKLEK